MNVKVEYSRSAANTPAFALIAEGWCELVSDGHTPDYQGICPVDAGSELFYGRSKDGDCVGVLTSPRVTLFASLLSIMSAVFGAWVFTKPVLVFLALDKDTYTIPVAVLVGLTGEGLMKWVIFAANNPKAALDMFRMWGPK